MIKNSEGLYNTLEFLDKHMSSIGEGAILDNSKTCTNSYVIDQAENEGYIEMVGRGSAKFKITVKGIVLLNQIRLTKATDRASKSNNRNFWIQLILSIMIGLATIFIGIIPFFR